MSESVTFDEFLLSPIRNEAIRQGRSLTEQITHWIEIGQAIEKRSSSFDYANIQAVFDGRKPHEELTDQEQHVWITQITRRMGYPSEKEKAFFAERRRKGLGAGLSETGKLVSQRDLNRKKSISMDMN